MCNITQLIRNNVLKRLQTVSEGWVRAVMVLTDIMRPKERRRLILLNMVLLLHVPMAQ